MGAPKDADVSSCGLGLSAGVHMAGEIILTFTFGAVEA